MVLLEIEMWRPLLGFAQRFGGAAGDLIMPRASSYRTLTSSHGTGIHSSCPDVALTMVICMSCDYDGGRCQEPVC